MKNINFKIRFKNPVFITQIVLAYAGLTVSDITSWSALGNLFLGAISNPYVLGLVIVSLWNAINDPTTSGAFDSVRALTYDVPGGNLAEYDNDVEDNSIEDIENN